jgi:hypothetical protein
MIWCSPRQRSAVVVRYVDRNQHYLTEPHPPQRWTPPQNRQWTRCHTPPSRASKMHPDLSEFQSSTRCRLAMFGLEIGGRWLFEVRSRVPRPTPRPSTCPNRIHLGTINVSRRLGAALGRVRMPCHHASGRSEPPRLPSIAKMQKKILNNNLRFQIILVKKNQYQRFSYILIIYNPNIV